MARRQSQAPCAVCKTVFESARLSRVVIENKTVLLCRAHAGDVVRAMPKTFDELRRLFLEPIRGEEPARRSVLERRRQDDRRIFPPRPEGRRVGGRRKDDVAA